MARGAKRNLALDYEEEHHEDSSSSFRVNSAQNLNAEGQSSKISFYLVSKKFWAPEEDMQLTRLVEKFGPIRWTEISDGMIGRSAKRCR
jgi:hypothetical protein